MTNEKAPRRRQVMSEDTAEQVRFSPISKHAATEERMTALLRDAGLPQPDTIEHDQTSVRFLWTDRKVAVVVDLAELDNDARAAR